MDTLSKKKSNNEETSCELTECGLSAPSRRCNSFHTGHNGATPAMQVLEIIGNILCLCFVMGNSLCLYFVMGNILCLYFMMGNILCLCFVMGNILCLCFMMGNFFVCVLLWEIFCVCDGKHFVFMLVFTL